MTTHDYPPDDYQPLTGYLGYSLESEQSILGALLCGHAASQDILARLSPNDFYLPSHRLIVSSMQAIDARGGVVDVITVVNELGNDLEKSGGLSYLADMAQVQFISSNVWHYVRLVLDKSRERRVLQLVESMRSAIVDSDDDSDTRVNNALSIPLQFESSASADEKSTEHFMREAIADLERRHESDGKITGLCTGFESVDRRLQGMQNGHLVILAGRPAMGKTTLALNFVEHAAFDDQPGAVILFSLEMPGKEVMEKMAASVGRIDYRLLRMGFPNSVPDSADEWPKLSMAMQKLSTVKNSLIIDDRSSLTVQQIRAKCVREKKRHGRVKAVYIDYLTYIRTPGKENRVNEVGAVSRSLKALAKELDCPVICLAQLSRKVEERADKRPGLADLRDSGEIEQDADVILFIYRDEYYRPDTQHHGIAEIITAKNRGGEVGTDYVQSDLKRSRFNNLIQDYIPQHDEPRQKGKYYDQR